jgi:hypothetical protein
VRRRTTKRDKTKELFWRKAIARQLESGLSQHAFCQKEGLNPNNFPGGNESSNRDSERATKDPVFENQTAFVPVAHVQDSDQKDESTKPIAEIDLSTGVVRIFAGINRHALHAMLAVLREVTY